MAQQSKAEHSKGQAQEAQHAGSGYTFPRKVRESHPTNIDQKTDGKILPTLHFVETIKEFLGVLRCVVNAA